MKPLTLILVLASVIVLLLSGFYFIESWRFSLYSHQTEGEIISFVEKPSLKTIRRARLLSYPVIQFQTQKGESISFTSKDGFYPNTYRKGDKIDILYHSHNPEHAIIGDYKILWLKFFLTFLAGLTFAYLAHVNERRPGDTGQ